MLTDQIRHLILNSGMTYREIFLKTGISTTSMSQFVSGRSNLSSDAVNCLCKFFKCSLYRNGEEISQTKPILRPRGRPLKVGNVVRDEKE